MTMIPGDPILTPCGAGPDPARCYASPVNSVVIWPRSK